MKLQAFPAVMLKNLVLVAAAYLGGSYFTALFHEPTSMVGGLWAVISAVIVIESSHAETLASARKRILGTLLGAIISGTYLMFFPFTVIGYVGAIGAGILVCYLLRMQGAVKLTAITISVVMIVAAIDNDLHPYMNAGLRFVESAIGTGMAVLVAQISRAWEEGRFKT